MKIQKASKSASISRKQRKETAEFIKNFSDETELKRLLSEVLEGAFEGFFEKQLKKHLKESVIDSPSNAYNGFSNNHQLKNTEPIKSFKYNNGKQLDQLESILNKLKGSGYLNEVSLPVFKRIFNDTPLINITPVNWKKNITSLRYFIKQFDFEMTDINKFKIAARCFTYEGNELTFLQLKNAKTGNVKPIENILKIYPFLK